MAVINEADPQGRDNQEAAAALGKIEGLELVPVPLVRGKAFLNAATRGLSVREYDDKKACAEFGELTIILFRYRNDIGGLSDDRHNELPAAS